MTKQIITAAVWKKKGGSEEEKRWMKKKIKTKTVNFKCENDFQSSSGEEEKTKNNKQS